MSSLKSLLSKGYFPKELPHCFTTEGFADALTAAGATPPAAFGDSKACSKAGVYSYARGRGFRRKLSLLNPVAHFNTSSTICANWADINRLCCESKLSASLPRIDPQPQPRRALVPGDHEQSLPNLRAEKRRFAKYSFRGDIANFYPSVYTHTIPWAVHTKSFAKANRGDGHYGNLLDKNVRNSQDQQTIGIPIGPDTSLVLGELLLSRVDVALQNQFPGLSGYRFIDDYEICFARRADADTFSTVFEKTLASLELQPNPLKCSVIELPQRLDDEWVQEIAAFRPANDARLTRHDIIRYFNIVFRLIHDGQSDNTIGYAISRFEAYVDAIPNDGPTVQLLQNILFQCVINYPSCVRQCCRLLLLIPFWELHIDRSSLTEALSAVIVEHAPLGHSHEVAWSVWAAMAFGVKLSDPVLQTLCKMDDPTVAVITRGAVDKGVFHGRPDETVWRSYFSADELTGENWLAAYEFEAQGWLPSRTPGYLGSSPAFAYLNSKAVRFYQQPGKVAASDIPKSEPARSPSM